MYPAQTQECSASIYLSVNKSGEGRGWGQEEEVQAGGVSGRPLSGLLT